IGENRRPPPYRRSQNRQGRGQNQRRVSRNNARDQWPSNGPCDSPDRPPRQGRGRGSVLPHPQESGSNGSSSPQWKPPQRTSSRLAPDRVAPVGGVSLSLTSEEKASGPESARSSEGRARRIPSK